MRERFESLELHMIEWLESVKYRLFKIMTIVLINLKIRFWLKWISTGLKWISLALKRRLFGWFGQSLENILFSMIKIIMGIFILFCLYSLTSSVYSDEDNIIILPFHIPTNQGYNGQALSDLLTNELIRINNTYQNWIDASYYLHMEDYVIPSIIPQYSTIGYSLSNVGVIGLGPVSLPIGDVILIPRTPPALGETICFTNI
jgi:hypothetical protein